MSKERRDEAGAKLGGASGAQTRGIKEQMEEIAYEAVKYNFAEKYEFFDKKLWLTIVVDAPAPKNYPATQLKHIDFPVNKQGLSSLQEWYQNNKAAWQAPSKLAQAANEES